MEMVNYIIRLKWGGIHPDIIIKRKNGGMAYLLKGKWFAWFARKSYMVFDAAGEMVLEAKQVRSWRNRVYCLRKGEHIIGKVGSFGFGTKGFIELESMARAELNCGWGFHRIHEISTATESVGQANFLVRRGVSCSLKLKKEFDRPAFVVAAALLFKQLTSRG